MSLTCQLQVILNNISEKKAEAVKKALEPDNVNFPKGLSLYVENIDSKLIFNFESKENMKQLVGTVDEAVSYTHLTLPTNREV